MTELAEFATSISPLVVVETPTVAPTVVRFTLPLPELLRNTPPVFETAATSVSPTVSIGSAVVPIPVDATRRRSPELIVIAPPPSVIEPARIVRLLVVALKSKLLIELVPVLSARLNVIEASVAAARRLISVEESST